MATPLVATGGAEIVLGAGAMDDTDTYAPRCWWHAGTPIPWADAVREWKDHPASRLGVTITASGIRQVVAFCVECGNQLSSSIPHAMVGVKPEGLPVFRDRRDMTPCEACGATEGTEVHHWAPKHLFGEEAFTWPTSFLCRSCHSRWHQVTGTGSWARDRTA